MVVVDVNILWFFLSSSLVVLMQAQALRLARTNRELAANEVELRGENGQLGSANEQLAEIGNAKNELLASVEHEVVAPLGAIVIAAEMARADGDATTLTNHCLSTILAECSKLERVVEALPTTDEREHHGLWWLESRVDVVSAVRTAASTMEAVAKRAGVQLLVECEDVLPTVWADHDRLVHVLSVLLDNAIMLSRPGSAVSLSAKSTGPEIVMAITQRSGSTRRFDPDIFVAREGDDGPVGDDEKISSGRLLWLKMCKEIVENRNGRIWTERHESGGSIFKVAFSDTSYEGRDIVYAN